MLKSTLWTAIALALVGIAAAPKLWPDATTRAEAKPVSTPLASDGERRRAPPPIRVSTYTVLPQTFAETVQSTGTLIAEEAVELQAEINGKVIAVNFREGTQVRKGDLLLKLNDADLRAALARATHRRELAELRERRLRQLLQQGVARREEYDIALSELDIQRAEMELTQAQIEKTEIRAPFDGVVGLRYVSEGAFVNAATRIATLQRLDKLKIDFSIPEKYAHRIRLGSPVQFSVAGGERKYAGEIYAFDPRIDTSTRTVLLRALCPNVDKRLLPGAFAGVELTLAQMQNAILVPAVAVIPGLAEKNVFVLNDGKAEQRAVETGTRFESTVHILSGLNAGDVVITSGLQQMRAGQAVVAAGEPI